jgi:hypothetical protein
VMSSVKIHFNIKSIEVIPVDKYLHVIDCFQVRRSYLEGYSRISRVQFLTEVEVM